MMKLKWVQKNEASGTSVVEKLWRAYWLDEVIDLLQSDELVAIGACACSS